MTDKLKAVVDMVPPELWMPSEWILSAGLLLLALLVHRSLRKKASKTGNSDSAFVKLAGRFHNTLAPLLLCTLLLISTSLWRALELEPRVLDFFLRVAALWLGICFVTSLSGRSWGGWFAVGALVLFAVLSFAGIWEHVTNILNSPRYALPLGKIKLTPYRILNAVFVFILLFWLVRALVQPFEHFLKKKGQLAPSNRNLIVQLVRIVAYSTIFLIFLNVLGIELTTLTVLGGAIGVGIGFGLQKITSNFISGIILLFERSVEEGDLVELSDGTFGFVRHTGARYTLVETFDTKEIMTPNEDFITQRVVNWTYSSSQGRVEIPVGVSYDSDIKKAQECMLEAALEHPRCSKAPEPVCYLREFGNSSVNFILFFWVDDVREGRYLPQSEVMFTIWDKFKESGIRIPFPQRDLHIISGKMSTESTNAENEA